MKVHLLQPAFAAVGVYGFFLATTALAGPEAATAANSPAPSGAATPPIVATTPTWNEPLGGNFTISPMGGWPGPGYPGGSFSPGPIGGAMASQIAPGGRLNTGNIGGAMLAGGPPGGQMSGKPPGGQIGTNGLGGLRLQSNSFTASPSGVLIGSAPPAGSSPGGTMNGTTPGGVIIGGAAPNTNSPGGQLH